MNKNIDIKNIKVAKRYALALAQSADKDIDEVFDNINSINDVIYENEQFRTFFLHPVVSLKDKKEAVRVAFDGKVNKISLNFVETLLDENRFSIFETIFELFKKEVDTIKNKQRVEVKSAVEIKEETIVAALDGLFYAFVISFVTGAFSWITNLGFFDIFAYNAIRLKEYWFKNIEKSHFYGTYDYTKSKKDKRDAQKFIPLSYIASSFIFLIGTIVVYIIYKTCI